MTYKAFVLGNGPSRPKDVEWLNNLEGDTYGCNALYRDWEPDFLLANDKATQSTPISRAFDKSLLSLLVREEIGKTTSGILIPLLSDIIPSFSNSAIK